jgi:hypothetical protein
MMERVFELVPRGAFLRTGIQFLNLNTIFQLFRMRARTSRAREICFDS